LEFSTAKNLGLGGSIVAIIGILLSIIPALRSILLFVIPALSFLGLILMLLGVISTRSFTWPVRGIWG
jgi:hypothetical protein